ncbi:methyltransferase domain-containing protein [Candidatus Halobonum tyrrellensis]|uniref:tRNA (guanine(10)-N(2))-dimethyltransferase n=1 Tax=Candidatus Halobonum tyrrellensis G22 TaxID=1324957 RepID=V4HB37_9EURY|nr:methyltransferase domain-containing protein [Candidatus Halobonum tyrrellensis]ESP87905.1 RNA methylase [Candidatus Halobonum tyrrellensis G22]
MPGGDSPSDVYGLELAGEEDAFAAREAATAAGGVRVVATGLALADGVDRTAARRLAYTRSVLDLLGRTDADPRSARAVVAASDLRGVRPASGSVAVRARVVRDSAPVSTAETERRCGAALVDRGFSVDLDDPEHVLRVLFADDTCLVGWVAAESVRDFGTRKPTDRPFFQPGSMDPMDARAYANLAGAGAGRRLLDPMCGTGGTLIEAGLAGSDVVGVDAQAKMVRGSRENLGRYVPDADRAVLRGDATALPLRDDSVDGVVFDAPYGRQSKIARHDLSDLVAGALSEAARVAPRGVLVADRSWRDAAVSAGWRVTDAFERRVHRSLVRHVHVLERVRDRSEPGRRPTQPLSNRR